MSCKILKFGVLVSFLVLGGCTAALPLALSSAAAVVTIVKDVIGIDVALSQDTQDKVKIEEMVR